MNIPLLDLKSQYISIKDEIDSAIGRVLQAQNFVLGEDLEKLEEEVAEYCMAKYGIGVASGTDALFLSLKALGIKEGDEVITTPFTFIATTEVISNLGAVPVFIDIDKKTYNIDTGLIEAMITKRTKAILPVHLYGQCADMHPILELAKRHNLKVIEDCAQAIGAEYKGNKAGSMGDAGCISFFPSKNLGAFGDGGMVVTNNKDIADSIRSLRVHGANTSKRYYHDIVGYNSRLDNLQAAILRVKLKYLDRWIEMRRKTAAIYNVALSNFGIIVPFMPEGNTHTYHLYVIALRDRDRVLKYLVDTGIESRAYYPLPLHIQKCYSALGYNKGDFAVSEWASENTLAIPIYPELKDEEIKRIVNTIDEAVRGKKSSLVQSTEYKVQSGNDV